jgi:hypothetical protein
LLLETSKARATKCTKIQRWMVMVDISIYRTQDSHIQEWLSFGSRCVCCCHVGALACRAGRASSAPWHSLVGNLTGARSSWFFWTYGRSSVKERKEEGFKVQITKNRASPCAPSRETQN